MAAQSYNNYDMDMQVNLENDKKRPRRVYSTALINQLIKDRSMGYDIDYDPFYLRDLDLRAPGITFKMTEEEMELYQKCYDDPLFYVENYCKFMTDKGMSTVELREFQKNVIDNVTQEVYIPENDDFGPKNRNIIWMASRQSGKCQTYSNNIEITDDLDGYKKCSIGSLYNRYEKKNLFYYLKKFLYILYNKVS